MMDQRSPSRLLIPNSSPSPASTTGIQTGRPPLWTNSSQRKMCRLYLYTTLSIDKILEVVHHPRPNDSMPGKDSANKKLNALLDKEPRWLKPRSESDMLRRCEQLARSPTRTSARPWASPHSRTHSYSAPPPFSPGGATPIKQELDSQSATLEVPPWSNSPVGQYPSSPYHGTSAPQTPGNYTGTHFRSVSDGIGGASLGSSLLRAPTGLSTSTDQTTGSFHRMLDGYSDVYIQSVKKLVKRYTAPTSQHQMGMSPMSETMMVEPTWVIDPDAPAVFHTRPFPLPGDLLSMDLHLEHQYPCFPESDEHQKRWCMCHAQDEAPDCLWATPRGPSPLGMDLIANSVIPAGTEVRDAFGNTLLHFLAARGSGAMVIHAVQSQRCAFILNARNSAGQTFLHVLGDSWFQDSNANTLCQLLDLLVIYARAQRFDITACDHYGRTFFHMLLSAKISDSLLQFILQRYGGIARFSRDAFGINPVPTELSAPTGSMDVDSPTFNGEASATGDSESSLSFLKISGLLKLIREASANNPSLEDEDGRNGLHCLAMASLSQKSVIDKSNPSSPHLQGRQKKKKGKTAEELLDSSVDKLRLRLSLLEGLLVAGVDTNHYDSYGNTPLMAFCAELPEDDDYKTGPEILDLLLNSGANIHARNRAGETALHIAVRCGRKLAVKTLLDRGANVHARDAAGRSLLALTDVKMATCRDDVPVEYCHYEACRAHLSGKGHAVQEPTILDEWGV